MKKNSGGEGGGGWFNWNCLKCLETLNSGGGAKFLTWIDICSAFMLSQFSKSPNISCHCGFGV